MRSLTLVLPSGTMIDTARAGRGGAIRAPRSPSSPPAWRRSATRSAPTPSCAERIARKFEIKNTTGYRLCAFLDADEPLEIFRRLLVGSEGTLAFVAEAVFDTVPLPPRTTSSGSTSPTSTGRPRRSATSSPPARRRSS